MEHAVKTRPLTPSQQQLVRENMGLVAVHLKRRLPNERNRPDGADRWDELFQDGCVGLIRAAETFDPCRGVPFAAHALENIQRAVDRSARRGTSSVRLPDRQERGSRTSRPQRSGRRRNDPFDGPGQPPKVIPCPPEVLDGHPAPSAEPHDPETSTAGRPTGLDAGRTLGELIHEKIHAAAHVALDSIRRTSQGRKGRTELAARLVQERILVADEQARTSLREIAERSGSSYGRVATCEDQLRRGIRRLLDMEREFQLLGQLAESDPSGPHRLVDPGVMARLCDSAADQLLELFTGAPRAGQAEILLTAVEGVGLDFTALFRAYAVRLDAAERTAWLAECLNSASGSGR